MRRPRQPRFTGLLTVEGLESRAHGLKPGGDEKPGEPGLQSEYHHVTPPREPAVNGGPKSVSWNSSNQ